MGCFFVGVSFPWLIEVKTQCMMVWQRLHNVSYSRNKGPKEIHFAALSQKVNYWLFHIKDQQSF